LQNLSDLLAALTSSLSDAFLGLMGAEYPANPRQSFSNKNKAILAGNDEQNLL
jgi:hypothetical protein